VGRTIAVVGLLLITTTLPALAKATFWVDIGYGETYSNNTEYIAGLEESDVVSEIEAEIPIRGERPGRSWEFVYRPSYKKYRDFSDLDHYEHVAWFDLTSAPSPKTRWSFNTYYFNTQSQGGSLDVDTPTTFLTYRTERELIGARYALERDTGPRWTWRGSLRAHLLEIDDISGFDSGVPPEHLGEQAQYRIALGGDRQVSRSTSAGFTYALTEYELDLDDDETVQSVRGDVTHATSRTTTIRAGLGVVDRDAGDETDVVASFGVAEELKNTTFDFRISRTAVNGGAIPGAYTLNEARVTVSYDPGRDWNLAASSRFAIREAEDPGASDLDLFRADLRLRYIGARFARGPLRGLGFSLRGSWVDQSGDDVGELESSYWIASFAVVARLGPK
jgi:hypothetical protein